MEGTVGSKVETQHGAWGAMCLSCYCCSSMQARPMILVVWFWKKTREPVWGSQHAQGLPSWGRVVRTAPENGEGEVMVKITAPDQDSNRASLARGERTGDSCFSFQQAAVCSQSQYYCLVLHHGGFLKRQMNMGNRNLCLELEKSPFLTSKYAIHLNSI